MHGELDTTSGDNPFKNMSRIDALLHVVRTTLPLGEQVKVLAAMKAACKEAHDIEVQLTSADGNHSRAERRLRELRHEIRSASVESGKQRLFELLDSHVKAQLNIIESKKKWLDLLTSIDDNFAKVNDAVARAQGAHKGIEHSNAVKRLSDPKKHQEIIHASAYIEREFQKSRRRLLAPRRISSQMLKLEAHLYGASGARFIAILVFGMAVFLLAGFIHEYHWTEEVWYIGLVAVPLLIALAELMIHKLGESRFEKWARRNLVKANLGILSTRLTMLVD